MSKNKYNLGFTLVELSVVLAIIGLVLGSLLTLMTNLTNQNKVEETERRMVVIDQAIAAYVAKYHYIPCPADPQLVSTAANYGRMSTTPSGTRTDCGSVGDATVDVGNVNIGVVPNRTLEIDDIYSYDAWGAQFTYALDDNFASSFESHTTCTTDCFRLANAGSITVEDSAGNNRTDEAVYTLVSHGKNNSSAWLRAGGASRVGGLPANEAENSDDDAVFIQRALNITNIASHYDDITSYKLKWHILDATGAITNAAICEAADLAKQAATDCPATDNTCCGATDLANCEAMAMQIHLLCLDGY